MKKAMIIAGCLAGAGAITYVAVNKKMRKKAEKMLGSMLDEADNLIQNQGN